MLLTKKGKVLRSIRMRHFILLKDMAKAIGITSSHLSSIEIGLLPLTDNLIEKIAERYDLRESELKILEDE